METNLLATQDLAQLLGTHALEVFLLLLAGVLSLLYLIWRLFERHYRKLWRLGNNFWGRFSTRPQVQRLHSWSPHFWSFLRTRLSPNSYLGLHLTLGLLISLVAANIFGNIAEVVMQSESVKQFDQNLATALYQNATNTEVLFFKIVTALAGRGATFVVGIGVGIILLYYRYRLLLVSWAVAILGNSLLNAVLKAVFQRTRPEFSEPILVEANYSFPSGHAMGAVVIYGMLAYFLSLLIPRHLTRIVLVVVVALALLIGFSRMYLGVHFFSDVLAGYIAGVGWLAIVISGTEVARRRRKWQKQLPLTTPKSESTRNQVRNLTTQ